MVLVLVAAASVAGCTGGDRETAPPETAATETSGARADPSDAIVPIETVAPITAPPAPTTTRRPPDRIAEPNPRWAPVEVPTGDPLRPAAPGLLIDDPDSLAYDISPDGRHLALVTPTGGLCLRSTTETGDEVCNDSIESNFVVWAPDSSKVLFNPYSFQLGRAGPLGTFAVDGTVTALVEPSANEAFEDGVAAAGFVDADTVLYTRAVYGPASRLDVHRIVIDGGDDRLIGSLSLGSVSPGAGMFSLGAELVDGATLYSSVNTGSVDGNGIWRYDAETDAFGRLVEDDSTGPSGPVTRSAPVAVRGGVLTHDSFASPPRTRRAVHGSTTSTPTT